MNISVPQSEHQLLERAKALAGLTIGQLAADAGVKVPENLLKSKGWVGQLIELCLGADAGCQPIPDFYQFGIELKTIPIDQNGKPTESTYVSIVYLINNKNIKWESSEIKAKLNRVLWVPIEANKSLPLIDRRIGMPLLWQPSPEQESILRQDWEELMDMVCLGQLEKIHSRLGSYLQIRPKAANAKSLCWGINEEGEKVLTLPRGFYLRSTFTAQILAQNYL